MTAATTCCPAMDTQWTQRVVERQHADVFCCVACGHVHRVEKYAICKRFPSPDRCVNCGGDRPEDRPGRCPGCGRTQAEDREAHNKLAALHPSRAYLPAARALHRAGREVLALKLATAEVVWGDAPVDGMLLRLEILEAMELMDVALDEAYSWMERPGAPIALFGIIAQLEAGSGNLQGAITVLERGLKLAPERSDWWCDLAEISVHLDDRPLALRTIGKVLADPSVQERALQVIADVGERYYADQQYAEALSACSLANHLQETSFGIAWLRARIAASQNDHAYLLRWVETALKLNPDHAEARSMHDAYAKRPTGLAGWFAWGGKK
jgi:tetratricopeptide (TPR) repeat protein